MDYFYLLPIGAADVIKKAKNIIYDINKIFPCRENSVAITKLDEAIMWLEKGEKNREKRGVEGLINKQEKWK